MRILLFILLLLAGLFGSAQSAPTQAPYLRFPTLPPLQLLLADSATKYTRNDIPKKKPVLIMLFSPECSHCQHTAQEMVAQKEKLSGLHIIMATLHPLWQMSAFKEQYKLDQIPGLVMGKDFSYVLPSFYGIRNLPYLAFYNKKGTLITGFEGSMPLEKILATFK
jgi:thioredoxin-related protein